MAQKIKWFHAIGACGHATAMVCKMFKDMGWFVTGTDLQFMPPGSRNLTEAGVAFEQSYHYTHLTKKFWEDKLRKEKWDMGHEIWDKNGEKLNIGENPDLCLIISSLNSGNKEYKYAKLKNIPIMPYAQILRDFLIKENSIVVIGTAGKTTTSSLLTYLLKKLDLDPSYMVADDSLDFEPALKNTNSTWSVIEGDEYHSVDPKIETHAKFLEYKPKYLIITNIGWEHQDIYPTHEAYIEEFKKAVEMVPEDGLIIAKAGDENVDAVVKYAKCKVIRYHIKNQNSKIKIQKYNENSKTSELYFAKAFKDILKGGLEFDIYNDDGEKIFVGETQLIGDYNIENIMAVVLLCLNVPELKEKIGDKLSLMIKDYRGVKKRLEILYKSKNVIIMNDYGVTPPRAKNSLQTIKDNFPDYRIVAIFEPYAAGRPNDETVFKDMYKDVFKDADEVIIPDLSTFNASLITSDPFVTNLKRLDIKSEHVENANLENFLSEKIKNNKNDKILIVFFSSYRLDEIANKLVGSISKS